MNLVRSSFAYDGKDFGVLDENILVQLAGNALIFWDCKTGKKDYKWSKRNGFCQYTTSTNNNLIAAVEYGLNPEVQIFSSHKRDLLCKFEMDTTFTCIDLTFSRDAQYLIMIGGVPDFKISIFDIENRQKLPIIETVLPCKQSEFLGIKFNPKSKDYFCILSTTKVYFYKITKAYQVSEKNNEKILGESYRISNQEYTHENPEVCFTSFIYDQYDRVHLTTDMPEVLQVNSIEPQCENTLSLTSRATSLLLTPKHMLVALEEGLISWYRIELPVEMAGEKDQDKQLKVLDEIDQQYNFTQKVHPEGDVIESVDHMHYNKSFKHLYVGTQHGLIGILPIPAEAVSEEFDEDENQEEKKMKVITVDFHDLGRYHTQSITGIKELGPSTQLATIGEDSYVSIWEVTNHTQLSKIKIPALPTAINASQDGKIIFVGTAAGILRIYDVSNRECPRLIKFYRFWEEKIPINCLNMSKDGEIILVSSPKSDLIYIVSTNCQISFNVKGHVKVDGYVQYSNFALVNQQLKVVASLSNNLLASFTCPTQPAVNRMEPYGEDVQISYRKVDRGVNIVFCNYHNGDIYAAGNDMHIKKYDLPTDKIGQIDFRKAPFAPVDEYKSHALEMTCVDTSDKNNYTATGGKDGQILYYTMGDMSQMQEIKAHSINTGGVSAISFSQTRTTLYSAGHDGSFWAWTVGGKPNPEQPIVIEKHNDSVDMLVTIQDQIPDDIKLFKDILQDEFNETQEKAKELFRSEIMQQLTLIKSKLNDLLQQNETVTDIEKLEREEYVIDVRKEKEMIAAGDEVCQKIREQADKTVLRLELLRERVIENTWNKMEESGQSRAIKSISGETLVFNYPIRKREDTEQRLLDQLIGWRKVELREKLARIEQSIQESLPEQEFSKYLESYFMNRNNGKPDYLDDDSIAEAAYQFALKDAQKKKLKENQDLIVDSSGGAAKDKPKIKITKGKLGTKTKKKDNDEDLAAASKDKQQNREIRGMEEMHWTVVFKKREIENLQKIIDNPNIFDMLYESFELFSDSRKRSQIEFIREVVFELKRDFNKEFQELYRFKEDTIMVIGEKNILIQELQQNLQQEEDIFHAEDHPLENPELIFDVDPSEVKVEKYYTAEELAAQEEERRKQAERDAALRGDNVGRRGLKQMMGGTELILKKEKNQLESELVKEDWMFKPVDDMTDEEKQKLKEFEQKEKEFKEKQKKAWEQELKKIKAEIIELQLKFEEKLLTLFKKKLFVESRILEQELFIIRLIIQLQDQKETVADCKKYLEEKTKLEKEYQEKEELIVQFGSFQQDLDNKIRNNSTIQEQERELKKMFAEYPNSKAIINFVKSGKTKKSNINQEKSDRVRAMEHNLEKLDPFYNIDCTQIKEVQKEDDEKEFYSYEKDNQQYNLSEEDFEKMVEERYNRIDMEKGKTSMNTQMQLLKDHILYLEDIRNEIHDDFQTKETFHQKSVERLAKLKHNFEVIVYLRQGQVEVPQLPIATDYKDAILINTSMLEYENKEIKKRGDAKVNVMNQISEFKTGLKTVKYQEKKLALEILDFEERAKDVQLYRVTKQTQEIIQGKHQKKDEEDKKRLENQIKQLEENAQKRIKTINDTKMKLKRDIREKSMENEQLLTKAYQLQSNVDQRKQIMGLKSKTSNNEGADPSKKIKEIAHRRKLLDIAKQQTEEIEFLRDELDRLRARTFPSFAHLHNKPEYPDEN